MDGNEQSESSLPQRGNAEARELIGSDVAADGVTATRFVFAQESDGRLRAGGSERHDNHGAGPDDGQPPVPVCPSN